MKQHSYSHIQKTRKETAHAYQHTTNPLWHYTYMLQDSVSSDTNYVDLLVCPEVHVAYVLDIYGTCFSYKHPCFDYDTRFLQENEEFAHSIIGDMMSSIKSIFPEITYVSMFSKKTFMEHVCKAKSHTQTVIYKSQLPLPQDICHIISQYCVPDWCTFDVASTLQQQSQHIQNGKKCECYPLTL